MVVTETHQKSKPAWLIIVSWVTALLVSDLTNAVWHAWVGEPPGWLFWIKAGLLLALVLASLVWEPTQPLRPFFVLLLVLILSLWGMNWLRGTATYGQWEKGTNWVIQSVN